MKLDWKGVAILAGAALLIYFITRRDLQKAAAIADQIGDKAADLIFNAVNPTATKASVTLTDTAQQRMAKAIELGYGKMVNGVFTITPKGEALIAAGGTF